ncbi:12596_t:CDS:1 [Gigaspora rosea]|nr:12596_t:CDS:1 [Gigaspora rosea]
MASEKVKESELQNIWLIFSNFKRQTDYPFLIWDGSEAQDVPMTLILPNLISDTEDNFVEEIEDRNRRQKVETKIAALNRLVEHLNIELAANNFRHVESVANNLGRAYTIINDIETSKNR